MISVWVSCVAEVVAIRDGGCEAHPVQFTVGR